MNRRLWIAVGCVALACACAGMLEGATSALANRAYQAPQDAQRIARCTELATRPVAIEEEYQVGGTVALNIVKRGKTPWVTPPNPVPASPPSAPPVLRQAWYAAAMPSTPRNELARYLNRVGKTLAVRSDRPTLEWTFSAIDSDEINAYSAPGGYVFVTRGLLALVKNEAQLAGVLGHEIGHVVEKHALKQYADIKATACKRAVGGEYAGEVFNGMGAGAARELFGPLVDQANSATFGFLALDTPRNFPMLRALGNAAVDAFFQDGFPKEDEIDADVASVRLIGAVGYDAEQYVHFIETLPVPATHHPPNDVRAKAMRDAIAQDSAKAGEFKPGAARPQVPPLDGQLDAAK